MSPFAVQVNTSLLTVWIKINMSLLTVWIKGLLLAVQKNQFLVIVQIKLGLVIVALPNDCGNPVNIFHTRCTGDGVKQLLLRKSVGSVQGQ